MSFPTNEEILADPGTPTHMCLQCGMYHRKKQHCGVQARPLTDEERFEYVVAKLRKFYSR